MVKVTITRLRAGLTGASGLVLLGQADAGCASPVGSGAEVLGHSSSAETSAPAKGSLTLSQTFPNDNADEGLSFFVQGPVNEFVRVGDTMVFDVTAYQLWSILYQGAGFDPTRYADFRATFSIQAVSGGDVVGTEQASVRWDASNANDATGTSTPFTVPATTDTLTFELTVVNTSTGSKVELSSTDFTSVPVFGGHYPLKNVLFDNDGSTLRQRVIEGGALVQGGTVDLSVSDWRADEIVQRSLLNTEIGTENNYNTRFGPSTVPLFGQVQYEIAVGYAWDQGYFFEQALTAQASPAVLDDMAGRTAYGVTLWAPSNSTQLDVYLHVKAYLVVNYTPYQGENITEFYAQGQRILLAEKWDNPNGAAFTNYVIPVAPPVDAGAP